MIDNLKALIQEIKQKHLEEFEALKVKQNYRYFHYTYEEMLSNWVLLIRQGNTELVDEIKDELERELFLMQANGERPSPKRNNPMMILTIFKRKLKRLHFEIDKSKIENEGPSCHCSLRQKHHLNPSNSELLKKYGRVYFLHKSDDYNIYQCAQCSAKWIHAYSSEFYLSKIWMEWNPKIFPLIEKIN